MWKFIKSFNTLNTYLTLSILLLIGVIMLFLSKIHYFTSYLLIIIIELLNTIISTFFQKKEGILNTEKLLILNRILAKLIF